MYKFLIISLLMLFGGVVQAGSPQYLEDPFNDDDFSDVPLFWMLVIPLSVEQKSA